MTVALPPLRSYMLALGAVLAATLVRALLDPVLGEHMPFYLFYFAVIVASLRGGIGPGVVALCIGLVVAWFFFALPRHSPALAGPEDFFAAFRFVTLGSVFMLGGTWVRSIRTGSSRPAPLANEAAGVTRSQTPDALVSVGDGIVTTDSFGRITFMNLAAAELTGWNELAAKGRTTAYVLKLVRGGTREPLRDPALRTLREEQNVTLPDNTLLIGKNGVERPIDIRAEAIRDAQGGITGTVLIFREVGQVVRTGTGPFQVVAVELFPSHSQQAPLSPEELERLELDCRAWLLREWRPATGSVRIVPLAGFNLTIQQGSTNSLPSGNMGLKFRIAYERWELP
ncbi:MAG: DUF4118 domain-containing protein [Flavobacteriales bacterium]|nr:DUF4118 domain-containing protein [Flavobacteriales bacterium]